MKALMLSMTHTYNLLDLNYIIKIGSSVIQDTAFIIVPVLTLWNLIPLLYYDILIEPISSEQITIPDVRRRLTRGVHFTICWAGLQVVVAVMHIVIICYTGMTTNETISCFVHKMSTQFMWGMTVWRAFPLERTTFFTLVSVIVTYSFLLLKLKDNPAVKPIMRSFVLENGTSYTTSPD
uniref:G_PROTEIN_RECEP_F1_2 domain-containing protein n=1 Tax=Heterorhabditis bacteriophora TaxID=37862 RepID=A0A1I7X3Q5_HETBA